MVRDELVIAAIVESSRVGKGPWMVWFPKNTHQYRSGWIKTKGELQALSSWLTSKNWHNSIFKDYKNIVYKGKSYTEKQGKLLYTVIKENDDWEAVKL